ncbi:MAG TPA: DUF2723 domain-containing protein [Gemmatimonadales bacterium]|nr:DUF2723 domain-containing protein [Gemmatimonadales bacterium]
MDERDARPPYRLGALTALAVFGLYLLTLAPTVQYWDAPEYMAAAHGFGIPHPPGNPLFVLMAHVWGLLPLAADYGKRINLFAAFTSACSAGLWFMITERWLQPIVPTRLVRRLVAFAGTIAGAASFTVWNQSVVNEKVYTVSLLTITLVLWLAIRWSDQPPGARRDNFIVLIVYLLVLTTANHQMGLLAGPAVLVLVAMVDWRVMISPRVLAASAVAVLIALTVYLILPLRAMHHPYMNEGDPQTWQALSDVLGRAQYGKPSVIDRQASFAAQIGMWGQYFFWQWGRDLSDRAQAILAAGFGVVGLLGAVRHWMAERRQAIAMITMMFTITIALIFYLNFKYGYSQFPGEQLIREVRERDYFFIVSYSAWGIWVAMGLATIMEWLQEGLQTRVPAVDKRWALVSPVAAFALIPLWSNHLSAPRTGETMARDFAHDLLNSLEPYAVVITGGDNDTFPLWYAQEVDNVRPDVTVIVTSLGNINWYLDQAENRPLPTYDPAAGPAYLRNRTWTKPGKWWDKLYTTPADTLPEVLGVPDPVNGKLGALAITIDPRSLPNPGYLTRIDLAVYQMIKEDLGKRPIYFSTTTADYGDRLGLTPYLVTEGMVRHLMSAPVVANQAIQSSPIQGRFTDIPLTVTLGFDVYHGASAARYRPRGWVDLASQNILVPYIFVYDTMAEALAKSDPKRAQQAYELALAVLRNTKYQFQITPPAYGR